MRIPPHPLEGKPLKGESRIPVGTEFVLDEPDRRVGPFWTPRTILGAVAIVAALGALAVLLLV